MQDKEYHLMASQQIREWWYVTKRAYLTSTLKVLDLHQDAQILELGSGVGANFAVLRRFGTVRGIEQSEVARKLSKDAHPEQVESGDLHTYLPKKNAYDLICIIDVLYHDHIKNDQKVLTAAAQGLKKGGYLVVIDCAHQWLFGPHDQNNMARQRYSLKELKGKVTASGVVVCKSSYLFWSMFPLFVLRRLYERWVGKAADETSTPAFLNSCFITLGKLEAKLLQKTSLPWGSSVLVVGQKQ